MIWWASHPSRARSERSGIAALEERSSWLFGVTWRLSPEARLTVDFDIDRLGERVPLTMTYPNFFPEMPPQVTSRDGVRLSGHQYGASGELCLERRPDNWDPSDTGAMMIESAHRLLVGEAPAPGIVNEVASAHRTTVGQDVRRDKFRFVMSAAARSALSGLPEYSFFDFEVAEHLTCGHWVGFPRKVSEGDKVYWDAGAGLPAFRPRTGVFVRMAAGLDHHVKADFSFLRTLTDLSKREDLTTRMDGSTDEIVFLIECAGVFRLLSVASGSGERTVFDYKTVPVPTSAGGRLPSEYSRLSAASVAIVGCGSVGSKIAASLARSEVGRFVLVDGDLLFSDNLVRNDLDWRSVGLNKPDAVEERIRSVNPAASVTTRRIDLGGQESSGATDAALVAIGGCDVIIDATADAQVFNLCAAVARTERKTMVWGEVFAGGIGGFVARLRPDVEPVPHAARRQILDWCERQGTPPPVGTADQYGLSLPGGVPPLVADDADVTIMAAHMTRMVVDAIARDQSLFPQAVYFIGLKPGWIFGAPFETWPVDLIREGEWRPESDVNVEEELGAMIREFFPKTSDGDAG